MTFDDTPLKGAYVITLSPYSDNRGSFTRLFCKNEFQKIKFNKEIIQINQAFNTKKYTFRGFHYQIPPYSETKIIRCVSGEVQDYIIDIRKNSSTFLKTFSIKLSEKNNKILFIPEGFAHGYLTLSKKTRLIYLHTSIYMSGFEGGLRFDDPLINITLSAKPKIISKKDLSYPYIDLTKFKGLLI